MCFLVLLVLLLCRIVCPADWPWAGESTVDGFLRAARLELHLAFFREVLGVEDGLDFLYVEETDVRNEMTTTEQRRFFRRVGYLRQWDAVQREHYRGVYPMSWQQWQIRDNELKRVEASMIVNHSNNHQRRSWHDAKVGMYLSFLDAAQYAVSESNRLSLREKRAVQSAKAERGEFERAWQRWRWIQTDDDDTRCFTTVGEMMHYLELKSEELGHGDAKENDTKEMRKMAKGLFACIDIVRFALRRASLGIGSMPSASGNVTSRNFIKLLSDNMQSVFGAPLVHSEGLSARFLHGKCEVVVCEEQKKNGERWHRDGVTCADNKTRLNPDSLVYLTRILSQRPFSGYKKQAEFATVSTLVAVSLFGDIER